MLTGLVTLRNPFLNTLCQNWSVSLRLLVRRMLMESLLSQGISAKDAYQLIHDELSLDGNPLLNLASFVHTWMPKEADQLMMENITKNLIDQDEYPMTRMSPRNINLFILIT